jgi:hypothetical protein
LSSARLLAIAVAAIVAVCVALPAQAQVGIVEDEPTTRKIIILLDCSSSMRITAEGVRSRWERAVAAASDYVTRFTLARGGTLALAVTGGSRDGAMSPQAWTFPARASSGDAPRLMWTAAERAQAVAWLAGFVPSGEAAAPTKQWFVTAKSSPAFDFTDIVWITDAGDGSCDADELVLRQGGPRLHLLFASALRRDRDRLAVLTGSDRVIATLLPID